MTVVNLNNKFFSQLENVRIAMGAPSLAEIGKIKIGRKGKEVKSQKGKVFRMPEKFDHFVITTNFKDPHSDTFIPDHALMEQIAKQTDQKADDLKFLPVMLLFDDPELNFIVRFSCYKGASAWCIGDGKRGFRLKKQGTEREEVQCPCERVLPDYEGNDRCKVFGRLMLLLQSVKRLGGVWIFRTTSWNSVRSIQSSMAFLRQLTGGVLASIPLTLTINPKTVVTPKGEVRTIYVVNLEYWGEMETLQQHAMRVQKRRIEYRLKTEMLEEQVKNSLASLPPVALDENDRDIAEEFFPESIPWDVEPEQKPKTPEPQQNQVKGQEPDGPTEKTGTEGNKKSSAKTDNDNKPTEAKPQPEEDTPEVSAPKPNGADKPEEGIEAEPMTLW